MKKYYFLTGIPRAGNTILSCILNQNKDIGVTGNSILPEIFYNLEQTRKNNEAYLNYPDEASYNCMLSNILKSYYSEWDSSYIIDRSSWGTPYNYELLQKYCPNEIKIICLVRNVEEVFASFIDWSNNNPKNYINSNTNNGSIDDKFRFLFNPDGQLVRSLASVKNLMLNHKENIIIIDYDDLVEDVSGQIDRIYEFLNIPKFQHNFNYIKQTLKYDDSILGNNLHKIRVSGMKRRKYSVNIPTKILDTCKTFNFWKTIDTL